MEDECNAAHLFSVCSMGARCICLAVYGSPIRALSLQVPLYTGSRYIRARCIRAPLYTDSLYTDSLYSIAVYGLAVYGPRYVRARRIRVRCARARCIRAAVGSLHTRSQYTG